MMREMRHRLRRLAHLRRRADDADLQHPDRGAIAAVNALARNEPVDAFPPASRDWAERLRPMIDDMLARERRGEPRPYWWTVGFLHPDGDIG